MGENIDREHEICLGRKETKKGYGREKGKEGEILSRDREIHCDLFGFKVEN